MIYSITLYNVETKLPHRLLTGLQMEIKPVEQTGIEPVSIILA
jgi:hypothetical protein